ncbi:zinc finger MYM-type protein 6-like [Macrobrachium nipponense]|uniref:zinc finger MYM-type protein 6-like n=1 Tax=Macrobrachium nipponense TaxID=159736 RepID=UPI0030C827EF
MTSPAKKKCRQYSVEYIAFGFIESPQNTTMPMCLLCMTSLSNESMRPSKLKKHLETAHKDKKEQAALDFFKKLRDEFQGRMTVNHMFTQKVAKVDRGMLASYKIAKFDCKSRFLDVDEICQEMLFALKLTTDTKGESIFKKLEVYFEENNIPLKNIVACATDGAAAMIGRYRDSVLT